MTHSKVVALALVTILVASQSVSAKRGCSSFGHSCFGGHGKRSSDSFDHSNQEIAAARRQFGQEETPPHPGYPRSELGAVLPSGDNIIPIRDGGMYDHDDNGMREVMKMRLRNVIKHWMDGYRRSQLDDGLYVDNV